MHTDDENENEKMSVTTDNNQQGAEQQQQEPAGAEPPPPQGDASQPNGEEQVQNLQTPNSEGGRRRAPKAGGKPPAKAKRAAAAPKAAKVPKAPKVAKPAKTVGIEAAAAREAATLKLKKVDAENPYREGVRQVGFNLLKPGMTVGEFVKACARKDIERGKANMLVRVYRNDGHLEVKPAK